MAAVWLTMFMTSTMPIIEIVLMCCMGAILARQGILHGQARQHLGQLVFYIFVPCLTFTKLASSVDLNNLKIWWPLPVNTALSIAVGLLIGWLTSLLIKPPSELKMHVIVATGLDFAERRVLLWYECVLANAGNVGNLPLVIVATVCDERTSIFARRLGLQCGQIGIAYVAFSMWVAGFVQYSLAYNLLKLPPKAGGTPPAEPVVKAAVSMEHPQQAPGDDAQMLLQPSPDDDAELDQQDQALARAGMGEFSSGELRKSNSRKADEDDAQDAAQLELQPLFQHQQCSSSTALSDSAHSISGGGETDHVVDIKDMSTRDSSKNRHAGLASNSGQSSDPWQGSETNTNTHGVQQAVQWLQPGLSKAWQRFVLVINLPTAAAIAGLAVGCAAPIKGLLFGADPPLSFLTDSLDIMAGAMIPCMMLVLGSVLHKGPGSGQVPAKVILGILGMRQILIPFLGTTAVVLLHRWGVFQAPDPLFFLVLLLIHTCPTAINLQTVVTIHQNKEAEMSCILFWQYICSIVTLPCFMTLYLEIIERVGV